MTARVSWIARAPVKALALEYVEAIDLLEEGLRGDRRFFLIDENDRLVNDLDGHGLLQTVQADYDSERQVLELRLPDGRTVSGDVVRGDEVIAKVRKLAAPAQRVEGPWDEALSTIAGEPVRLVAPPYGAVDRGRGGAVTLLGEASLTAMAGELGVDSVDGRRFRMNFGIEDLEPHGEDRWIGRRVRIGEAIVVPQGNVGRCAVTTQNPGTGMPDLDTLKALARYRLEVPTTEPLPFGIHAAVAEPGRVRVGDTVSLL